MSKLYWNLYIYGLLLFIIAVMVKGALADVQTHFDQLAIVQSPTMERPDHE